MCPAEAIHQSLFTFTLRYFFIIDYPLCTLTVIILAFRYYSLIFSSLLRGDIDFRHRELLIAMFIINTNRVNTQPKIIILNFTVFFRKMVHEEEECYQAESMRFMETIPPEVAQIVTHKLVSSS